MRFLYGFSRRRLGVFFCELKKLCYALIGLKCAANWIRTVFADVDKLLMICFCDKLWLAFNLLLILNNEIDVYDLL